jgi:hypothetical protein
MANNTAPSCATRSEPVDTEPPSTAHDTTVGTVPVWLADGTPTPGTVTVGLTRLDRDGKAGVALVELDGPPTTPYLTPTAARELATLLVLAPTRPEAEA